MDVLTLKCIFNAIGPRRSPVRQKIRIAPVAIVLRRVLGGKDLGLQDVALAGAIVQLLGGAIDDTLGGGARAGGFQPTEGGFRRTMRSHASQFP